MGFNDFTNRFQERVEKYLDEEGVSQRELARRAGLSHEIIHRTINTERPKLKLDTFHAIVEAMDSDVKFTEAN